MTYLYFIGYFIAFIIFSYRKFLYLKEEIDKLFKQEKNEENKEIKDIDKDIPVIYKQKDENNNDDVKNNIDTKKEEKKKYVSKKYKKRKSFSKYKNNSIKVEDKNTLKKSQSITASNINKIKYSRLENKVNSKLPILDEHEEKNKDKENNLEINLIKETKTEKEFLSNYELNDLEYSNALELDSRNFFRIYWYLLNREHLILFTFFNLNDFNIFSIKCSI